MVSTWSKWSTTIDNFQLVSLKWDTSTGTVEEVWADNSRGTVEAERNYSLREMFEEAFPDADEVPKVKKPRQHREQEAFPDADEVPKVKKPKQEQAASRTDARDSGTRL